MSDKTNPPEWARKFLYWFSRSELHEELLGDLEENFYKQVKSKGARKARWIYTIEVLKLFRPSVWEFHFFNPYTSRVMITNYTKIAFRNTMRNKLLSSINLLGFGLSLSTCLFIACIVVDQLSFDKFHSNYEKIYRINTLAHSTKYGWTESLATTPLPLAENLQNEMQGITDIVRIRRNFFGDVKTDKKVIPLSGHMADQEFFNLFSFQLLEGNPDYVLANPFTVVLTESSAHKLYGDEDPIGKTLEVGRFGQYKVTGVMKDPPRNSHMQFDMIGSFSSLLSPSFSESINPGLDDWSNAYGNYIYFMVPNGNDLPVIQAALHRIADVESGRLQNLALDFELQKLGDITPGRMLSNQIGPVLQVKVLWTFVGLAGVILVLACFNYVNLTLAQAMKRIKEVGIRKAMGGGRMQLFNQFIFESILLSLLSVIPTFYLLILVKPQLMSIIPSAIGRFFYFHLNVEIIISVVAISVVAGLIAGLIPAIIISRTKSGFALKDNNFRLFTWIPFRKGLTAIQFLIAIFFLVFTILVTKYYRQQLTYDLGFAHNHIFNIELKGLDHDVFQAQFGKIPSVSAISFSSYILSTDTKNSDYLITPDRQDTILAVNLRVDENYIRIHQFTLLAGNSFDQFETGNENRIIINEKMVRRLGLNNTNEAIGKTLLFGGEEKIIAGVVKDFYHNKASQPIEPFFFQYAPEGTHYANLLVEGGTLQEDYAKFKSAWNTADNGVHEFNGRFYDDQIEASFGEIRDIIKTFGFSSTLTILIALLGILGIVVFTTRSKIKEVGIRKVLGSSEGNLIYRLSKGYIYLMGITSLFAMGAVYLLYTIVIEPNLVNRPDFTFWDYLKGVLMVIGLGLLIVVVNTFKIANTNPAETLKEE